MVEKYGNQCLAFIVSGPNVQQFKERSEIRKKGDPSWDINALHYNAQILREQYNDYNIAKWQKEPENDNPIELVNLIENKDFGEAMIQMEKVF